jgi:predicted outer membrane repeat protein
MTRTHTPMDVKTMLLAAMLCAMGGRPGRAGDLDLNFGSIPTNDGVTITFDVTVNLSTFPGTTQLVSQGQVTGGNFAMVLSDDPDEGGATDPTVTPIVVLATDPVVVYVSPAGSNLWPYTNWIMAATTIQTAVNAVWTNGTVWVTNGLYNAGGAAVLGLSNRVALTKPVTVLSTNGPANTFIVGQGPLGSSAVRCVYMTNGTLLAGFTLTNGFTVATTNAFPWDEGGGGAFLNQGGVLSNCLVRGNTAIARGGGVWLHDGGLVYGCKLSGNVGATGGGASLHDGTLSNCRVTGNTAAMGGGVHSGSPALIRNNLITFNTAPVGGGLALISTGPAAATVQNCTVCSNTAAVSGGGIHASTLLPNPGPTIDNTIVYYNSAPAFFGPNWYTLGSPPTYSYCCTTPLLGLVGAGNIDSAPLFTTYPANDFRLGHASPCRNSGQNQPWMATAKDLDGAERLVGPFVDRGAYEFAIPTDVVLYSFWLESQGGQVVVHWQTASEIGTVGFNLYRLAAGEWVLVNTDGLIPAKGAPLGGVGASYAYVDVGADPAGAHIYRLVEIETGGTTEEYGPFERSSYELRLVSPLTVLSDGGVAIRWLSRAGDTYRLYRTTSLLQSFEPLSGPLSATPPENVYIDRTDRTATRYYQVRLEE